MAVEDLAGIASFTAVERGAEASERLLDRFRAAFRLLARHRWAGHRRPDVTQLEVRFWSVAPFLIVYFPEGTPLEITRVMHGARDIQSVLEEPPG